MRVASKFFQNSKSVIRKTPLSLIRYSNRFLHSSGPPTLKQLSSNSAEAESQRRSEYRNNGMRQFLKRVGLTTAAGLGCTTIVTGSMIASLGMEQLIQAFPIYLGVGFVGSLISSYAVTAITAKYDRDEMQYLKAVNTPSRVLSFAGLSTSIGVMIAPMISMVVNLYDPDLILVAAGITASTMAGLIHYSLRLPNTSTTLKWGPALHIGLWGLIGNGIIALVFGVPEPMFWIDCIGGTQLC